VSRGDELPFPGSTRRGELVSAARRNELHFPVAFCFKLVTNRLTTQDHEHVAGHGVRAVPEDAEVYEGVVIIPGAQASAPFPISDIRVIRG
jgi:hypothetical protein